MASKVGSTWYLAIRLTPKPGQQVAELAMRGYVPDAAGAIVYAGVVLTSRRDGEWGYKAMCETMGPHEAAAPCKLLDLLSPLDPKVETFAAAWRERVAAHHAARRARPKVRPGDVIEFERTHRVHGRAEGPQVPGLRLPPASRRSRADPLRHARHQARPHRPHERQSDPGPGRARRRARGGRDGSGRHLTVAW